MGDAFLAGTAHRAVATILRTLRIAQNLRDATEGSRRSRAVAIHPHAAAGGQTANVTKQGIGIGYVSPQKVADVPSRIGGKIDLAAIPQWFYLRSYSKSMPVIRVVERFDPKWIARQKETFLVTVPNGKRVHAAQLVQHRFPASLVKS